jgi:hypothetical protein
VSQTAGDIGDDDFEPLPPWGGIDPDISDILCSVWEVSDQDGDEMDLVARLVSERGEAGALRLMAKALMDEIRIIRERTSTETALLSLEGWLDEHGCPTCQAPCDHCVDEAEEESRVALSGLGL